MTGFLPILALSLVILLLTPPSLHPKVFMSREKALQIVYPDADTIEKQRVYLSKDLKHEIEQKAKSKLSSSIYTFYVGKKGGDVLGYSVIDTHTVRTETETVLITINPDGTLRQIDVLAFFEPRDYLPTNRWMGLFPGRSLTNKLRIDSDIPHMTGATLTSNAIVDSIRRAMALFETTCSSGVCKGI